MAVLEIFCRIGSSHAIARFHNKEYPALIGENGPLAPHDKREGDGYTPLGRYPLLQGYYRVDRADAPNTDYHWQAIQQGDGWGEDPHADDYNQFQQSLDANPPGTGFWQEGPQRDLIIVIGYNGAGNSGPIVEGKGSAVFIHPHKPGARHSRGCVMLGPEDTRAIAEQLRPGDEIDITLT